MQAHFLPVHINAMNDQNLQLLVDRLGIIRYVYAIRPLLALLNYRGFRTLKNVVDNLPLKPLLERQPRFLYKFLAPYAVANFKRRLRLDTLITHYQFLGATANPRFFAALAQNPVIWSEQFDSDSCSISVSFPQHSTNEAEISLNLYWNSTLTQVVSFVVAPGSAVGSQSPHVLLITQVQGYAKSAQLKDVTKALHEITPACLLVNAAYGFAAAWKIDLAAGISAQSKVGKWIHLHFDYDAFWQDFKGEYNANTDLYSLPVPAPEKPIAQIKRNHRARTLRKRLYKEQVREHIAAYWHSNFSIVEQAAAVKILPVATPEGEFNRELASVYS